MNSLIIMGIHGLSISIYSEVGCWTWGCNTIQPSFDWRKLTNENGSIVLQTSNMCVLFQRCLSDIYIDMCIYIHMYTILQLTYNLLNYGLCWFGGLTQTLYILTSTTFYGRLLRKKKGGNLKNLAPSTGIVSSFCAICSHTISETIILKNIDQTYACIYSIIYLHSSHHITCWFSLFSCSL